MTLVALLAAGSWCGGCSRHSSKLYPLPSDKKIHLVSAGPGHFRKGLDALVVNCEADDPLDDQARLRREANEIWTDYRGQAERANLRIGIVRILHTEVSGSVTQTESFGFTFFRRADGWWQRLPDKRP